jgi:hypothetical protein
MAHLEEEVEQDLSHIHWYVHASMRPRVTVADR